MLLEIAIELQVLQVVEGTGPPKSQKIGTFHCPACKVKLHGHGWRRRYFITETLNSIQIWIHRKRCSLTAKQNSQGQRQWFIGYKAHMGCDDFGVPVAYTVTGACVHDTQAAIPLMKLTQKNFDFLYVLMDKGYVSADIEAYVHRIGRKSIIAQRSYKGVPPPQMDSLTALRYEKRTVIERTNGELKDGYLPVKLYRKGEQARYDISLAILLTTIKKVLSVASAIPEQRRKAA